MYHSQVLFAQYYKIVKEAQATTTETPPPLQTASVNSDLFPPPDVPLENAHNSGFAKAFTRDMLASLPLEEDEDEIYDRNQFYGQTMGNGMHRDGCTVNELGGRSLVASGSNEGVVTAAERIHEVAVLEQPGVVLETARFTTVVSPPADQLMMAQQVSSLLPSSLFPPSLPPSSLFPPSLLHLIRVSHGRLQDYFLLPCSLPPSLPLSLSYFCKKTPLAMS